MWRGVCRAVTGHLATVGAGEGSLPVVCTTRKSERIATPHNKRRSLSLNFDSQIMFSLLAGYLREVLGFGPCAMPTT